MENKIYMVLTVEDEIVGIFANKSNAEKLVATSKEMGFEDRVEEYTFDD